MILRQEDNGRTVPVAPDEDIIVLLEENPTTGYRWTVEAHAGLELVADTFQPGGAPGTSGRRELRFRPQGCGVVVMLRMKHWCEWEGEQSVLDRFEVTIRIGDCHADGRR